MASPSEIVTEAHHYIPRFYLKGFTQNKQLWVYEKGKVPRASKPKDEAQRNNYYMVHDAVGHAPDSVERMLSKIESIVAPTFRRLANPQFEMGQREIEELYSFVALTFVRVPSFRDYMNRAFEKWLKHRMQRKAADAAAFVAQCKEMEAKTGKTLGDHEKLRLAILKGNYELEQKSAGFNLAQVFTSGMGISDMLLNEYKHDLWYAPAGLYYMTCDNPVVTIHPDSDGTAFVGMGFGWRKVEVIFPLNKRVCLRLRRGAREQKLEVSERKVDQINQLMMHVADQFLYASTGYRRTARLFDQWGSKVKYGENAFVPSLAPAGNKR